LLAITISDDAFFDAAQNTTDISIDLNAMTVTVGNEGKEFGFGLSQM
jgi:hypothetical protein